MKWYKEKGNGLLVKERQIGYILDNGTFINVITMFGKSNVVVDDGFIFIKIKH